MELLQSSSDQTDYRKYPAIIAGTMEAVLPEQLAVWSYPLKDGDKYEASFNMVNAMLGRIHQSGHLAELPAESFEQVKNGIKIYKEEIAPKISQSIPFFPLRMPTIADQISPVALALEHPNCDYYAIWCLAGQTTVRVEMKKTGKAEVTQRTVTGYKMVTETKTLHLTDIWKNQQFDLKEPLFKLSVDGNDVCFFRFKV